MESTVQPRGIMSEAWLILETSGRVGQVGLARGGSVIRTAKLDDTRRHARDLASTVESILKQETLRPGDLTGVMVSRGPGSYTGLRVGIMSAKALAYATGCQLIAVETFSAIAMQAPIESERLWVIADALQNHVYIQKYTRSVSEGLIVSDELRIERVEDSLITATCDTWITGPGVTVFAEQIPKNCSIVTEADREPRVESIYAKGLTLEPLAREDLFAWEPLYLRGSSAEEKAKAKGS